MFIETLFIALNTITLYRKSERKVRRKEENEVYKNRKQIKKTKSFFLSLLIKC
jgi:Ca2+-dependent lipid-binding protein